MRALLVLFHRYIGLATALFLMMAGITGSLLAFNHELDEWLNPGFYAATAKGRALPPGELVDTLQSQHPKLQVWYMEYPQESGHTAMLAAVARNDPATGKPFDEPNQVFYLDPVSGEELGRRAWGACCFQRENLIPFILEFHYNLTLPGNWGLWLMGLVADFGAP